MPAFVPPDTVALSPGAPITVSSGTLENAINVSGGAYVQWSSADYDNGVELQYVAGAWTANPSLAEFVIEADLLAGESDALAIVIHVYNPANVEIGLMEDVIVAPAGGSASGTFRIPVSFNIDDMNGGYWKIGNYGDFLSARVSYAALELTYASGQKMLLGRGI
jgi:hypothetical protein